MSMDNILNIAGSGMSAQQVRLSTTASNLSNAEVVAGTPEGTYKPRYPVFSAVANAVNNALSGDQVGVAVKGIETSNTDARKQYQPGHPLADKDGYVYTPDINPANEMANLISASRSYQLNAQVFNTAKQLMSRTLQLGQ